MTYAYNGDNTVATKVDAKNQKVEYFYDAQQRVSMVKRYPVNGGAEDICQRTANYYDTNTVLLGWSANTAGRLAAVEWGHETACGVGRWYEMYSYTAAGLVTKKRLRLQRMNYQVPAQVTAADLDGVYGWNNEGQMTTMTQPGYFTGTPPVGSWNNGAAFTLGYDGMARLNTIQQTYPSSSSVISAMAYGAANQVTSITYGTGQVQTRLYNERLQMTRMTVTGLMDLEYMFSASANNGQATAMKNHLSMEEVQYTYDSLKRLMKADTVGPEWRQEYGYDGFGNLLSKTVTKGSAPGMSVSINPANNRVNGYTYDANGNATVLPATFTLGYDVENRMVSNVLGGGGSETYGYAPDGKRIWRNTAAGQNRVYFYGLNGERQGIYSYGVINGTTGDIGFYMVALESVVPKGLQVDRDRLGSVVSGGLKYDPWGAEFTVTSNDRDKFGTYYRDSTGLNYAEQRYYGATGGRFLSADPYVASAGAGRPQSWNRYVYVEGDPANLIDPRGLAAEDAPPVICVVNGQTYHGSFACAIVPLLNPFGGSRQGGAVELPGVIWNNLESASNNQLVVDTFRRIHDGLLSDRKCLDWLANGTSLIGFGSLTTRGQAVLQHVSSAAATTLIGSVTLTWELTNNGIVDIEAQTVSHTAGLTYNGTHIDILINRDGPFFRGSDQDRVATLLHELAHVFGARRFLPGDNIPGRAPFNESVLKENCGSVISGTGSN